MTTTNWVENEIENKADGIAGETGAIITGLLVAHVYPRKLGRVFNSQTDFDLPNVGKRQPDVAFVRQERLAVNTRDAVPLAPDLAVEVFSKSDSAYDMDDKVRDYLKAGVRLVWVVRPISQTVEVYQANQHARILEADDELNGSDVLPDFKIKVRDFFNF